MKTTDDVLDELLAHAKDLNNEEFNHLWDEFNTRMKAQRKTRARRQIRQWRVGDKAQANNARRTLVGIITKVKQTKVLLETDSGTWDVPASMLSPIEE